MIIGVENFKIFKEKVEFDLNGILILTGPNGSGKSTLAELLTIMYQNFKNGPPLVLDISDQKGNWKDYVINRLENYERIGDPITFYWYKPFSQHKVQATYEFRFGEYRLADLSLFSRLNRSMNEWSNLVVEFRNIEPNYYAIIDLEKLHNTTDSDLQINIDNTDDIEKSWNNLLSDEYVQDDNKYYFYEILLSPRMHRNIKHEIKEIDELFCFNTDEGYVFSSEIRPLTKKAKTFEPRDFHHLRFYRFFERYRSESLHKWCNQMLNAFGLGEELVIDELKDGVYAVKILKNDFEINIEALSTGEYNLVCLIVFIATNISIDYLDVQWQPLLLQIVEPESFLHPDFQSKLAYLVKGIIDYKASSDDFWDQDLEQIIIMETHSEYFIRKLQYLVASKALDRKFVRIYYFDKILINEVKPYLIEINESGALSRPFGKGFLDEADNLAIDLFKYQMNNPN